MSEPLTSQQLLHNSYHLSIRSSLLAIQSIISRQETMLRSDHFTFDDIKSAFASQNTTLQSIIKNLAEAFSKISSYTPPLQQPRSTTATATPAGSPPPIARTTTGAISVDAPPLPKATASPPQTLVAPLEASPPGPYTPSLTSFMLERSLPINPCSSPLTPPTMLFRPSPSLTPALFSTTSSLIMFSVPLDSKPKPTSSPIFHQTSSAPSQTFHQTDSTHHSSRPTSGDTNPHGCIELSSTVILPNSRNCQKVASDIFNQPKQYLHTNFTSLPPRSTLEKLTSGLALSNLATYESRTQSNDLSDLDTKTIDFDRNKSEMQIDVSCKGSWLAFSNVSFVNFLEKEGVRTVLTHAQVMALAFLYGDKWTAVIRWVDVQVMFVEMNILNRASKVFIFDPGGIYNLECTFDLEDKVIFEGSVMIR